jgi:hypothetical protein
VATEISGLWSSIRCPISWAMLSESLNVTSALTPITSVMTRLRGPLDVHHVVIWGSPPLSATAVYVFDRGVLAPALVVLGHQIPHPALVVRGARHGRGGALAFAY